MYVSVKDLILFCIGILIVILLVVIVNLIVNLNRIIKKAFFIVEKNEENVSIFLEETPKLVQNINVLTLSGQSVAENVEKTVENLSCFVEEKTQEFSSCGRIALDIMKVILEFIKR